MGTEDDVVVNMVIAELERSDEPDPRRIQISMQGFLDSNAAIFALELWKLLLSAQENYQPGQKGIPTELIQEKLGEYAKIEQVFYQTSIGCYDRDPSRAGKTSSTAVYSRLSSTSIRTGYTTGHPTGVFASAHGGQEAFRQGRGARERRNHGSRKGSQRFGKAKET